MPPGIFWVVIAVPALFSIAIYSNNLQNTFAFDDHLAIEMNEDVTNNSDWVSLWGNDFWGRPMHVEHSHKSYRPLTVLSFKSNVYFAGLSPKSFLLFNNVLHALNSSLVTILFWFLYSKHGIASDLHSDSDYHYMLCTMGGILFAAHPVHVEAVSGIVGRAELLSCTLGLVAFLLHAMACNSTRASKYKLCSSAHFILAYACFIGSVLCKETGVMLLILTAGYEVLRSVQEYHRLRNINNPKVASILYDTIRVVGVLAFLFFAYLVLRVMICHEDGFQAKEWYDIGLSTSQLVRKTENPLKFTTGLSKVLSTMYIQTYYARLLFYPAELCAEYSFNCISMVEDFYDPRLVLVCVTHGTVLYLVGTRAASLGRSVTSIAFRNLSRSGDSMQSGDVIQSGDAIQSGEATQSGDAMQSGNLSSREYNPVVVSTAQLLDLVALAWVLVPFIPASNMFATVGTLVAERLLYVPSVGFCIGVSHCFRRLMFQNGDACKGPKRSSNSLAQESKHEPLESKPGNDSQKGTKEQQTSPHITGSSMAFMVVLASWYVSICITRNSEWYSDETLFESATRVCSQSAKVNEQYSRILQNKAAQTLSINYSESVQFLQEAQYHLQLAREIHPDWCDLDVSEGRFLLTYFVVSNYTRIDLLTLASQKFQQGLDCIYTSGAALEQLQQVSKIINAVDSGQGHDSNLSDHEKELLKVKVVHQQIQTEQVLQAGDLIRGVELLRGAISGLVDTQQFDDALLAAKRADSLLEKIVDMNQKVRLTCDIEYWRGRALELKMLQFPNEELANSVLTAYENTIQCSHGIVGAVVQLATFVTKYSGISGSLSHFNFSERVASVLSRVQDLLEPGGGNIGLISPYLIVAVMQYKNCAWESFISSKTNSVPRDGQGDACATKGIELLTEVLTKYSVESVLNDSKVHQDLCAVIALQMLFFESRSHRSVIKQDYFTCLANRKGSKQQDIGEKLESGSDTITAEDIRNALF